MSSEIQTSVTKSFTWKIPNIKKNSLFNKETTLNFESECFTIIVDKYFAQWYLFCEINKTDLQLNLYLHDFSSKNFEIGCKFNIDAGKRVNKIFSATAIGRHLIEGKEFVKWSFSERKEFMENFSNFVVDGALIFHGEITVTLQMESESDHETESESQSEENCSFASYKEMFENEVFADFKIQANDGEIFRCHKSVLASNSQVFYQMLTTKLKESKEGFCSIPEFDSETIEAMLKFMYFREVDNMDEISTRLIFAAEKYELNKLKSDCIKNLIKLITKENVVEFLILSEDITDGFRLFKNCVPVILKHFIEIRKTEEWQGLPQPLFRKISEDVIKAQLYHIDLHCDESNQVF